MRIRVRTFSFLVTALAIAASLEPSRADSEAAANSAGTLGRVVYQDTVVVTSTKLRSRLAELATSATVIGPAEIRLAAARSVQDLLTIVPGAHILDLSGSETQGAVESRGFAAQGQTSHVLVLIDEIPINDLEGDRVDWNLLAQPQLSRIEFLRGPASFLYGNASMAGVVNLVTRPPGSGPRLWAQGSGGSEGHASAAGGVSWMGSPRADGSFSGSWQSLDGFRSNSAWHCASGYAFAHSQLSSGWDLRARLLAHHGRQQNPGPLPAPQWGVEPESTLTPTDHRDDDTYNGSLELSGRATHELELVSLVSGDLRNINARETIIPAGTLDRSSRVRSGRAEVRLDWKPAQLPLPNLLVGGEIQRGTLQSRYFNPASGDSEVGAGDVIRLSGAAFALLQARLDSRVTLTGGARMDWLRSSLDDPRDNLPRGPNDDLRAFSPTASLNLTLPHSGNAYLSYAGSFKAPALEQLYDQRPYVVDFDGPGPMPPVILHIANPGIQPQRAQNGEAGVRTPLGERLSGDAAIYYARSKNEIGFDLANFRLDNIDRSIHYGFEGGLTLAPLHGISAQLSYAYTRAKFDGGAHDGHQINTVPEHSLFGRLSLRHPENGTVTLEGQEVQGQWLDEDNHDPLPGYFVANLAATQSAGAFELFGSVRNLFDHRYATLGYVTLDQYGNDLPLFYPAAGRSYQIGLRVSCPAGVTR